MMGERSFLAGEVILRSKCPFFTQIECFSIKKGEKSEKRTDV
jgi:hypothetical protein